MNQRALILSLLVGAAAVLASALTAPEMSATPMLAETDAAAHIPVEAEDASVVALDQEVDTALHHYDEAAVEADATFDALDAEMGIQGMRLDSNTDMTIPTLDTDAADAAIDAVAAAEGFDADVADEEDTALLAEGESVSVAMGDETEAAAAVSSDESSDESSESASAAVDSDEDAAFLEVAEADEEESEAEDEAEDESESESESEDVGAVQTALIEQIVEANLADGEEEAAADMPRLSEAHVEIVADAETAAAVAASQDLGVTVAEEDHTHDTQTEMMTVEDFDTAKLAQSETDAVRTAGAVTAGLADATIEEKNVPADVAPVDTDVIAVVSDADARKAAGAPVAMLEVEAEDASTAETETETETETEAEHDETEVAFQHQSAEEMEAEQQKLDLMHSILVQIRTEQGKPVDDELTPADMDLIEEKMAVMSLVEVNADTETKAEAEHPRDHTVVPAMAPNTEATTPGAKLSPATIVGAAKPLVAPKPNYRWDIQYHGEDSQRIKYRANKDIELVDKPHPVHARDPTAPSKLKKPTKPGVWDRRPFELRPKQQYRYDVQYENRAACCRRREACCIRGVNSKTIAKKVKKPVRIVDPAAEARKAAKKAAAVSPVKKFVRVEYEGERARCCATRSACCAPPQAMYRADVQYDVGQPAEGYVVIANSGERALVIDPRDAGEYTLEGAEEMSVLERIQARQQLLHKLLLSHDSPYYYDDHFDVAADPSDAHIVMFHEPRAARDPNQLTVAEQRELQQWMQQLPVVPHLSVVELTAEKHAASGDAFLQTAEGADAEAYTVRPVMKPARVLKGFVDVEQEPSTLSQLLSALPPTPAAAEEQRDELADAEAEAEADYADDL